MKLNSIKFKIVASCLTLIQAIFPVASALGDSLSRYDTASYWVTHRESELTEYWGLPDGRISFPDGRSLITYKPGRTIGGAGLKMEQAKYLREEVEFRVSADGLVQQYAVGAVSSSDTSHPWLIFIAGMVAGVVLVFAVLGIALSQSGFGLGATD